MAKKIKRLSVNTFEKVAKEIAKAEGEVTIEWHDVEITITRTLGLEDMLEFVENVVGSCFDEEQGYMPHIKDFAIKSNILSKYANFTLPGNINAQYDLIYGTDAVDVVCSNINSSQLREILHSIDCKIDYLCDSRVTELQDKVMELVSAFNNMYGQFSGMFDNLNSDDIKNIIGAIGADGGISEDKIVKAYIEQTNQPDTDNKKD